MTQNREGPAHFLPEAQEVLPTRLRGRIPRSTSARRPATSCPGTLLPTLMGLRVHTLRPRASGWGHQDILAEGGDTLASVPGPAIASRQRSKRVPAPLPRPLPTWTRLPKPPARGHGPGVMATAGTVVCATSSSAPSSHARSMTAPGEVIQPPS